MSAAQQRERSQRMAGDLVKRGIYHGKRMTRPAPNSGGMTAVNKPGSSKYHRYVERMRKIANPHS